jgi:hypothetical protein
MPLPSRFDHGQDPFSRMADESPLIMPRPPYYIRKGAS